MQTKPPILPRLGTVEVDIEGGRWWVRAGVEAGGARLDVGCGGSVVDYVRRLDHAFPLLLPVPICPTDSRTHIGTDITF